ncbi:hypothetical protein M5D96_010839 [Drosophila gunungcola]|uniref:Uncharacterized protein n=1 Tax=Drosophila gunungcola TaxID=103775 RepID=A0A9Q0BLH0_9MUSC|nr:hypothetical protein M5D96_010839 [Drosophila gunungcola]
MSGIGPSQSNKHPSLPQDPLATSDFPWPGPIASGVSVDGSSASSTHRDDG